MGLGLLVVLAVFIAGLRRTTWRVPSICSALIVVLAITQIAILQNDRMPQWMAYDAGRTMLHQLIGLGLVWGIGRGIARAIGGAKAPRRPQKSPPATAA